MLNSMAFSGFVVRLKHIPGHRGILGNELADRLAVEGARKDRIIESQWNKDFDDVELDGFIEDMITYDDDELDEMIAEMENI